MRKHITTGPRDISVDVGDTIELHVKENTSRDYCWSTTRVGKGLVLRDVRFVPSMNPLPGATSERVFYLRAKRPGVWPLSLRMRRMMDLTADSENMTITVT
ncbi:protease inhibitor I42 family protein [Rhodococcus chondri]|uniref:Protease inhibitor I42 family protein n=1 Tax=Rhodococcus chondri TaxID=3065941 RepID=A0ABU7JW28_9NOCA|nr:protease inhibitor I42 family protein [Rhodococcus sp. CC-R104]MEE2034217.1 protease inhibitor I42 family protein [Rhodococcus sp. CC-R104]